VFKDAHAPLKTALLKKASGMAKPKELVQKTHQTTIDGLPVSSSSQDTVQKTHKKPETKALHNTDDSNYITDDESDDGHKGGMKIFLLLLEFQCYAMPSLIHRRRSFSVSPAKDVVPPGAGHMTKCKS
jgi:hypothetical protein